MKIPKVLLIAVAAIVVAAAFSGYCVDAKFREWDRRVRDVEAFAEAETARADSAVTAATEAEVRADSALAFADSVRPEIRERIVRIREELPPDTARDAVIDDLVQENDSLRVAVDEYRTAAERLREGYNSLLVVNDSLTSVLADRPKPRARWMPSLQVGVFAGVCSDGKPCVGVGGGLTVEVKIPTPRLPWDG